MSVDIKNIKIGKRYAQALMEVEDPRVVLSELLNIEEIFTKNEELKDFLEHPIISIEDKKSVISEVFGNKVSEKVLNFLYLITQERRVEAFSSILECLKADVDALNKVIRATVTSAVEFEESSKERLKSVLEQKTNARMSLVYEIEPSLIGGFRVKIQDKVFDLSTRAKLEKFESKTR